MGLLRQLIAILSFAIATMIIISIIGVAFNWLELFAGLSIYVFSYYVWPSKRRGKRAGESAILDIIEVIIEFPFEFFGWIFRPIGRLFGKIFSDKGNGIDIDLDL